jgi:hypothetical protein
MIGTDSHTLDESTASACSAGASAASRRETVMSEMPTIAAL